MNRILSLLGLVRRAGKMAIGYNETLSTAKSKKAYLIMFANDISPKTAKEANFVGEKYKVPVIKLDCMLDELSASIGIKAGVVAVTEKGFAEKLLTLHNTMRKDESAI